ncbi:MAG: hypothetical protein GXY20_02745 [Clostridiales bacterium]|nr:hypothetical protein [Clostridiales bacterium]
MSIFRPYQYKQKPDFPANAPLKNGFFVFWEIYFRKFWRLLTVNILYFIITMPILFWFYIAATGYFADSAALAEVGMDASELFAGIGIYFSLFGFIPRVLYLPLLIISILLYGPATMGVTYIYRNFAREEHAWVSDLFTRGIANIKQGLFFGIMDAVVIFMLLNGAAGIILSTTKTIAVISTVLRVLASVMLVFYLYMRHYFYLISVTMNLSVSAIIKDSILFVFIGFPRNVLAEIVNLLIIIICFFLVPLITFISVPFFFYAFTGFATIFICYPVVKKYLILPALEKEKASEPKEPDE